MAVLRSLISLDPHVCGRRCGSNWKANPRVFLRGEMTAPEPYKRKGLVVYRSERIVAHALCRSCRSRSGGAIRILGGVGAREAIGRRGLSECRNPLPSATTPMVATWHTPGINGARLREEFLDSSWQMLDPHFGLGSLGAGSVLPAVGSAVTLGAPIRYPASIFFRDGCDRGAAENPAGASAPCAAPALRWHGFEPGRASRSAPMRSQPAPRLVSITLAIALFQGQRRCDQGALLPRLDRRAVSERRCRGPMRWAGAIPANGTAARHQGVRCRSQARPWRVFMPSARCGPGVSST